MSEEILINVFLGEVRIALLQKGILKELYIERSNQHSLLGNIYKGKVTRLAPGMQAAFVDIGLDRTAFLPLTEGHSLREGQEIGVQIYKDKLGTKGVKVTTALSIPSRYLVVTPNRREIQVSQKITQPAERERLKNLLTIDDASGYIIRTSAQFASLEEIEADQRFLKTIGQDIELRLKQSKVGDIVYEELPLTLRVLRDFASPQLTKIRVDDEKTAKAMQAFAARCLSPLQSCIEYYEASLPLFDLYTLEEQIQHLLQRKVPLKSGAYLVIDQTEAMTTIDVNTGSFLGGKNPEKMIFQTNLEAANMIADQIRLRNLGGIIMIDFIDMSHLPYRGDILTTFITAVSKDSAQVEVHGFTHLGLMEVTRKRTRESLEHTLCDSCKNCQKRGSVKSIQTVSYEILREIKRFATIYAWPGFLVTASPEVILYLGQLEPIVDCPIQLQSEPLYGREQFSVLPLG